MDRKKIEKVVNNYKETIDNQDKWWIYIESAEFLLDYQTLLSLAQSVLDSR